MKNSFYKKHYYIDNENNKNIVLYIKHIQTIHFSKFGFISQPDQFLQRNHWPGEFLSKSLPNLACTRALIDTALSRTL
jgi:hypothetical protein